MADDGAEAIQFEGRDTDLSHEHGSVDKDEAVKKKCSDGGVEIAEVLKQDDAEVEGQKNPGEIERTPNKQVFVVFPDEFIQFFNQQLIIRSLHGNRGGLIFF